MRSTLLSFVQPSSLPEDRKSFLFGEERIRNDCLRSESRLFVLPFSPLHRGLGLRSLVGSCRTFKPFYSCLSTQSSLVYMRAENKNRTRSVFLGPVARLASSRASSSLLHLTGVGAVVKCCIERLGSGGPRLCSRRKDDASRKGQRKRRASEISTSAGIYNRGCTR